MPDPRTDPLDALLIPLAPDNPDPGFAAALRDRLEQALDVSSPKEFLMSAEMTPRPRNGVRHGDVSYITLGLPDVARGRAFYGSVLGWRFSPGNSEHGAQVDVIVPMMGLWDGEQPAGDRVHGAVLGFRVDDIASAVSSVRSHGGTISEPHREPYGLAAEGFDDQGIPFYLHEMPGVGGEHASPSEFHNGDFEGDVSYLTMVVPDLAAARAFYGGVFGWTFNIGRAGGAQVNGVAPQIGMTTKPEAGPATPGVILCYRVGDLASAVQRVGEAGGTARAPVQRPYGRESLCGDDQGTPFYLHQF
jgi:predicted enzyme related to lactoylglutathione lyase